MGKRFFGLGLIRGSNLTELRKLNLYHSISRWTNNFSTSNSINKFVLANLSNSFSQLQQDLVALWLKKKIFGTEDQGYFVEFGATNGIQLSNTFMLEKFYGWDGLLCEPSINYYHHLQKNRNVTTDNRCVFSTSGEVLEFVDFDIGEHSSISGFSRNGEFCNSDKEKERYQVESVTLEDLLTTHNAPTLIHFLSIDTEGSEYEILKDFEFHKWEIVFICVELSHNSELIVEILISNGYLRILSNYSRWDGWFVHQRFTDELQDLF
jgi:FkbM family methyltransferase